MKGVFKSFFLYWRGYGGIIALLSSLYVWLSLVITLIIAINNCDQQNLWEWYENVINIIPSILGFALGGYAILVGFGDEKFLSIHESKYIFFSFYFC